MTLSFTKSSSFGEKRSLSIAFMLCFHFLNKEEGLFVRVSHQWSDSSSRILCCVCVMCMCLYVYVYRDIDNKLIIFNKHENYYSDHHHHCWIINQSSSIRAHTRTWKSTKYDDAERYARMWILAIFAIHHPPKLYDSHSSPLIHTYTLLCIFLQFHLYCHFSWHRAWVEDSVHPRRRLNVTPRNMRNRRSDRRRRRT